MIDLLNWPVSWTWCHHCGPGSHSVLLRAPGQARALGDWFLRPLLDLKETSRCRAWNLASQRSLWKLGWRNLIARESQLSIRPISPKENQRWDRSGQRNSPLLLGSFEVSFLERQSSGIAHTDWQPCWVISVSSHSPSWSSSSHRNASRFITSYPSLHPLHGSSLLLPRACTRQTKHWHLILALSSVF